MELSKREVTLTMKWSHNDLVFTLIGEKKILCEEPCKCCWLKRLATKEEGKEKQQQQQCLQGLFLQRITAKVRDNGVQEEKVDSVEYLPLSALFPLSFRTQKRVRTRQKTRKEPNFQNSIMLH